MPQVVNHVAQSTVTNQSGVARRVTPSRVDPSTTKPFTLEQELELFGSWSSNPIWVPPKDASKAMAESMLSRTRPFAAKEARWQTVVEHHRSQFTQVREIDLVRASIRLPKGKFFVTVTEQQNFDTITDTVPACVQTRLDEFLAGPGKQRGVKVYYLKPLCVEVDDQLILTTTKDLQAAITKIQNEVFAEYRKEAPWYRSINALSAAGNAVLALPRSLVNCYVNRRQRAIDAYQAKLEFKRRKTALGAARTHRRCRTDGCTFDEMLELTNPIKREDVVEQYAVEQELSKAQRDHLMQIAVDGLPWFMALSFGLSQAIAAGFMLTVATAPPVAVCDPAFVAEMPDSKGKLLKIGHFGEVAGVTHVEI
ncbi:MAG: hypothetical protein AAGD11_15330 [Planctomycetota bacterium]